MPSPAKLILEELAKRAKLGDGLAMDHASRMKRAEEQGFDTGKTWLHGTGTDFDSFDNVGHRFAEGSGGPQVKAHWFTENIGEANRYAGNDLTVETGAGNPNVIPAYLNPKKVVEVEDRYDVEDAFSDPSVDAVKVLQSRLGRITDQPQSWMVVRDPSNIRSVNAAFDPAQSKSSNLLASTVPAAATLGAVSSLTTPEAQANYSAAAEELQRRGLGHLIPGSEQRPDQIDAPIHENMAGMAQFLQGVEHPLGNPYQSTANVLERWSYGEKADPMDIFFTGGEILDPSNLPSLYGAAGKFLSK